MQVDPVEGGVDNDCAWPTDPIGKSDLTGKAWWEDAWAATVGAAQAVGDWAWENRRGIAHYAVNLAVGAIVTGLVVATCVGTAGIGCVALVAASVTFAVGVPAHLTVDAAVGHRTTGRDVMRYTTQSFVGGLAAPYINKTIPKVKSAIKNTLKDVRKSATQIFGRRAVQREDGTLR